MDNNYHSKLQETISKLAKKMEEEKSHYDEIIKVKDSEIQAYRSEVEKIKQELIKTEQEFDQSKERITMLTAENQALKNEIAERDKSYKIEQEKFEREKNIFQQKQAELDKEKETLVDSEIQLLEKTLQEERLNWRDQLRK